MKVVYNSCYGGFGLSDKAMERYAELKGISADDLFCGDIERDDPALVQVVEELGDKANSEYSDLSIRDIPAGTLYRIDEYDGSERVVTRDEYDWKVAR